MPGITADAVMGKLDEGMLGGIAFVGTARNVQVLGNSDGGMV